jgi:hypothetical protein
MNGELFTEYLRHLRERVPMENRLFLICDVHASHRTPAVKELADELNIELIYIPPGATDLLQPLDRKVFGALKSEARRLFRLLAAKNPELKLCKKNTTQTMCDAWNALSAATIASAWEIYSGEEKWEEMEEE